MLERLLWFDAPMGGFQCGTYSKSVSLGKRLSRRSVELRGRRF
jgi:hypothetical protein